MPSCPTCGHNGDGLTAGLVDRLVDWDAFDFKDPGDEVYDSGVDEAIEVMAINKGEKDSYGYVVEAAAFVVVRIGDKHFKKEGVQSSYSGLQWNGACREVQGKPRTITVFDYV